MTIRFNGHPVIGFGQAELVAPAATASASPWPMVLATSVVSALAGWTIEEVASKVRGKRR